MGREKFLRLLRTAVVELCCSGSGRPGLIGGFCLSCSTDWASICKPPGEKNHSRDSALSQRRDILHARAYGDITPNNTAARAPSAVMEAGQWGLSPFSWRRRRISTGAVFGVLNAPRLKISLLDARAGFAAKCRRISRPPLDVARNRRYSMIFFAIGSGGAPIFWQPHISYPVLLYFSLATQQPVMAERG